MKFGAFTAPWHKATVNPTVSLRWAIELTEHLDRLGYDEVWFGEHHSGGVEIISSPEIMIAAAAERTSRIRLGSGVVSIPYHNPLVLADRFVQLDHLTRGRAMLGVGPGQLLEDAQMMGIDPNELRPRMNDALSVILRLLDGETVTETKSGYSLHNAKLQLLPYSNLEVAVTASVSPNGPQLAGRLGTSMISVAATDPVGIQRLGEHWNVVESEAAHFGKSVRRENWRLMGMMHVAETMEEARRDVEYGLGYFLEYLAHLSRSATAHVSDVDYSDVNTLIDSINSSGRGVIGTPDMAIAQLERLEEMSGGFGCYLFQNADWARKDATLRSYSLFAEEVMPRFQGSSTLHDSYTAVLNSGIDSAVAAEKAQAIARAQYEEMVAARSEGSS